jgi:hypothetical protein
MAIQNAGASDFQGHEQNRKRAITTTGNSQVTILFPVSVGIAPRPNSVPYLELGVRFKISLRKSYSSLKCCLRRSEKGPTILPTIDDTFLSLPPEQ